MAQIMIAQREVLMEGGVQPLAYAFTGWLASACSAHEIALSSQTKRKKRENPLVIRCKFGAVTNSRGLTGTQTTAGLDVN